MIFTAFVAAGIWLLAGWSIFFVLLNRVLLHVPDTRGKSVLISAIAITVTFVIPAFGFFNGFNLWLTIPLVLLTVLLVGEAHRLVTRRRTRAAAPVEQSMASLSLAQPLTTQQLVTMRYEESCLPRTCRPIRIAHISDLHVNERLPMDYYNSAMDRVSESDPDLVFITGDFISDVRFAPLLAPILKRIQSKHGIYAVLGNHDYWAGAAPVVRVLADTGIVHLANRSAVIEYAPGNRVLLLGCEDPWGNDEWYPPAVREPAPILALTHTADNIYALSRIGATAVFAGHYHGGQIQLPIFGTLAVPSRYGRRFDHGHFRIGNTHLFVTTGVGVHLPAFRLYCRPEILITDLSAARA